MIRLLKCPALLEQSPVQEESCLAETVLESSTFVHLGVTQILLTHLMMALLAEIVVNLWHYSARKEHDLRPNA